MLRRAGLEWEVVDHDAPAPLAQLWARGDLGAAMMCGLPFSQRKPAPTLVAAPMPSPPRYGGRPVYCTDIVVAADSLHASIEDTFGGVVGYTLADSMSGAVALRDTCWRCARQRGTRLYARGGRRPRQRARRDRRARRGRIDVGPLDSYSHDLLRHYDPVLAARVRTIASTPMRPIPPLVATAAIGADALARLRDASLATRDASELGLRRCARLLLAGFAVPDPSAYDALAPSPTHPALALEEL